jgi:hypothetical protein
LFGLAGRCRLPGGRRRRLLRRCGILRSQAERHRDGKNGGHRAAYQAKPDLVHYLE